MRRLTVGCLLVTVSLVVLIPEPSSAGPLIVGEHPKFENESEPQDKVVHVNSLSPTNGIMANLVLTCLVTGVPTPTVTWYRETDNITGQGIQINNTLALNVTDGDGASRDGVLYHCRATNSIGPNGATITATIRSRYARVTYAYFEGFQGAISTVNVEVVQGSVVALECTVPNANPKPVIRWVDMNGMMITSSGTSVASLEEDGRYLYLTKLDVPRLEAEYHCEVTNVRITEMDRSPITYTLSNTLNVSTLVTYKPIGDLVGRVGGSVNFVYVAGYKKMPSSAGGDGVTLQCLNAPPLTYSSSNNRISIDDVPQPVDGSNVFNITCGRSTSDGARSAVMGTLTIVEPATITSPLAGDASLEDRDVIVGGSLVTYTCESKGSPTPTPSWYYNGDSISASSGVVENGKVLTIPTPAISNSGIYQCFVTNILEGEVITVQRAWILEVRAPQTPIVRTLTEINPLAVRDRLVETLIVLDINATDIVLTVEVNSDPCPNVQWLFNDSYINSSDSAYSFNNACSVVDAVSPYNFTFTISVLAMNNSGFYFATFDNEFSPIVRTQFYVTVPVDVEVLGISLVVVDEPSASCLLNRSNVTLTCDIVGYPRPPIVFSVASVDIDPSMDSRIASTSVDQIIIYNVVEGDEALYSCEARPENEMVIPLTSAKDFVFCTKPIIESISSTMDPMEGEQLVIQCNITGTPLPTVTWLKDNVTLSSTNNLQITKSQDSRTAIVTIAIASVENSGRYTCVAKNAAASVSETETIEVQSGMIRNIIIGVACAVVGIIFVILLIILLVCVYFRTRKAKGESVDFHPYNVDMSPKVEENDGRGNVDADSFDGNGNAPEAFNPEYESLPARRPLEPPPYKATPGYGPGPIEDDMEMIKYPPQDSESFVAGIPPYSGPQDNNGYRPSPDDFMSEDAQFV